MIITVGNQKGGTGKSLIAQTLAVYASRTQAVLLIDADKQASCSLWYEQRQQLINDNEEGVEMTDNLSVIHADGQSIKSVAQSSGYDLVLIDVGGYNSRNMELSLMASDVIIAPTQPKGNDVLSLDPFVHDIKTGIEQKRHMRKGALFTYVVFNIVPTHPSYKDAAEAKEFVQNNIEVTGVIDSVLRNRVDYDRLSSSGRTALEGKKQIRQEAEQCMSEISKMVGI